MIICSASCTHSLSLSNFHTNRAPLVPPESADKDSCQTLENTPTKTVVYLLRACPSSRRRIFPLRADAINLQVCWRHHSTEPAERTMRVHAGGHDARRYPALLSSRGRKYNDQHFSDSFLEFKHERSALHRFACEGQVRGISTPSIRFSNSRQAFLTEIGSCHDKRIETVMANTNAR